MSDNIIIYLFAIPAILISLSFHEMAHAFVSYRLGDPTAKRLGRLTMNPLKHLDPFGTLMLLISMYKGFGFGWARPVPIDPSYYKNHKRGTIYVSLAGPVSNLVLSLLAVIPMVYIAIKHDISVQDIYNSSYSIFYNGLSFESILFNTSRFFYTINIGLAIFNILPIPPLDGSKVLTAILPEKLYFRLMKYEQYIGMAFLALMLLKPEILSKIMWPLKRAVEGIFMLITSPVVKLFP